MGSTVWQKGMCAVCDCLMTGRGNLKKERKKKHLIINSLKERKLKYEIA